MTYRVLLDLKQRYESISVANGYFTDVAGVSLKGFDLRDREKVNAPNPYIYIVMGEMIPEEDRVFTKGGSQLSLEMFVESYRPPTEESVIEAHQLSFDLMRATPKSKRDFSDPEIDRVLGITSRLIVQPSEAVPFVVTQLQMQTAAFERYQE